MTSPARIDCGDLTLHAGPAAASRRLVQGLTWRVDPGQRWAVLGPNGAGKSSLLAALAGVRAVQGGTLRVDGVALETLDANAQAARRAFVPDRWFDPFPASVLQTVLTGRYRFGAEGDAARAIAYDALARLECAHVARADVRTLSRGERQRVAIATAFVQDTPLLLLDEPVAHQDPRHQALVLDVLRDARGRTVIASLHDVNAALRFATHALLLSGRGTWSAGPVDAMLTADRLSALYATPFVDLPVATGSGGRLLVQPDAGRRPPPL